MLYVLMEFIDTYFKNKKNSQVFSKKSFELESRVLHMMLKN